MPDFDLTSDFSLKIELHMLRPITEKVHSGNGSVSLVNSSPHPPLGGYQLTFSPLVHINWLLLQPSLFLSFPTSDGDPSWPIAPHTHHYEVPSHF